MGNPIVSPDFDRTNDLLRSVRIDESQLNQPRSHILKSSPFLHHLKYRPIQFDPRFYESIHCCNVNQGLDHRSEIRRRDNKHNVDETRPYPAPQYRH